MIYALYKGDTFLAEGTLYQIHEQTDKSLDFLKYMRTPSYRKSCEGSRNKLMLIPIVEESE